MHAKHIGSVGKGPNQLRGEQEVDSSLENHSLPRTNTYKAK